MATILYVDDEPAVGQLLGHMIGQVGHHAVGASSVHEALQVLARESVDLVISDHQMPGLTGLDLLDLMKSEGYDIPLIMLTGYATIEHAVTAIKAGALDYITKPVDIAQLEIAVEQALTVQRLKRENAALRDEVTALRQQQQILGDSPAIQKALAEVAMAAPTRASVLLLGESGTGKELFARAIHEQSDRRNQPFIKINCAAIPEGLIESALFGHEKGAFTGAIKRTEGAFERAHRGTLLLDEIGEMRLDLQAKLLRVIQEGEFERVGGETPMKVDVRIIATSNRELAVDAAEGRFRQDLYFRLAVVPIVIPPLRERAGDIPLLAMRFAMRAAEEYKKDVRGIAPDAMDWLRQQSWPGNVRELQHLVERAVVLSRETTLSLRAFTGTGRSTSITPVRTAADEGAVVLHTLNVAEAERRLIETALARTGGNRTHAAELLGISLRTLRSRLNTPNP
ncbi:MAG: sigma-54-dependent Fis family transcriptional regulator [Gemmatimonadaceae bacterium]|nr:sigma-54-dependent Fis family transcriptional regulator [Gemmatimonadaceae bacterium]MCW5827129.1 sigma-54-dependent Fis family transcriptional regulator [Gemmatimonadaceae bacterium]